jgi:hypothetical protein
MENKRVYFYACTSQKNEVDTLLYKSLIHNGITDYNITVNFKGSLTKQYNILLHKLLQDKNSLYSTVIFCHDDITINTNDLRKFDNEFVVFGLAGTSQATIKHPFLWHLSAPRENHLGAVAHYNEHNDDYFITSFGPFNKQAVLIDGVFMGINLSKWKKNPIFFDENIPSKYHFYDLAFSLDNNLAKNKVGVIDFPIIHCSHGLHSLSDQQWQDGEKYILKKYDKYTGTTIAV